MNNILISSTILLATLSYVHFYLSSMTWPAEKPNQQLGKVLTYVMPGKSNGGRKQRKPSSELEQPQHKHEISSPVIC